MKVGDLFFHVAIPEVLLIFNKKRRLMTTELLEELNIASSTFYKNQIVEKLEEMNIIRSETIREGRKETKWLELTPQGEEIAKILALVFDEKKKVFPIPKEQVKKLQKACEFKEVKAQGIETWQDFVKRAIEEKYSEFASTKLLID